MVYLRSDDRERGFQVYLADLRSGESRQVTHAPYLAFDPQVARGTLRFLNRDGWRWTLDEQPIALDVLPAPPPVTAPPAAPWLPPPPAPASVPWWPVWPAPLDERPVEVLGDTPYSAFAHLFALQTHAIDLVSAGRLATFAALTLGGADRLQFHRWALEGIWQLASPDAGYGAAAAYANRSFAPFTLIAAASALRYQDSWPTPPVQMSPSPRTTLYVQEKRHLQADLGISRDFYGAPAQAGLTLIDDDEPNEPTVLVKHRRAAGAFVNAEYAGIEATPYSGARRALVLAPSVAVFPNAWTTAQATLTDLRLEAIGVSPLPLSRRHTLSIELVGRSLLGLPAGQRWLQTTRSRPTGSSSPRPTIATR